jgi:hypothetical protein
MDILFSNSTPEGFKGVIREKIGESAQRGFSELATEDNVYKFSLVNNVVVAGDARYGETTCFSQDPESEDLVAEKVDIDDEGNVEGDEYEEGDEYDGEEGEENEDGDEIEDEDEYYSILETARNFGQLDTARYIFSSDEYGNVSVYDKQFNSVVNVISAEDTREFAIRGGAPGINVSSPNVKNAIRKENRTISNEALGRFNRMQTHLKNKQKPGSFKQGGDFIKGKGAAALKFIKGNPKKAIGAGVAALGAGVGGYALGKKKSASAPPEEYGLAQAAFTDYGSAIDVARNFGAAFTEHYAFYSDDVGNVSIVDRDDEKLVDVVRNDDAELINGANGQDAETAPNVKINIVEGIDGRHIENTQPSVDVNIGHGVVDAEKAGLDSKEFSLRFSQYASKQELGKALYNIYSEFPNEPVASEGGAVTDLLNNGPKTIEEAIEETKVDAQDLQDAAEDLNEKKDPESLGVVADKVDKLYSNISRLKTCKYSDGSGCDESVSEKLDDISKDIEEIKEDVNKINQTHDTQSIEEKADKLYSKVRKLKYSNFSKSVVNKTKQYNDGEPKIAEIKVENPSPASVQAILGNLPGTEDNNVVLNPQAVPQTAPVIDPNAAPENRLFSNFGDLRVAKSSNPCLTVRFD